MGIVDRRRHVFRRFPAGIAEHDPLVACPFILVAAGVNAQRDIRRLLVHQDDDIRVVPVESVLRIADVAHGITCRLLDQFRCDLRRAAHFARNDDLVGRAQRLHGNAGVGICGEVEVDDAVGNAVADFVGMSLSDGFAGKHVRIARHFQSSARKMSPQTPATGAVIKVVVVARNTRRVKLSRRVCGTRGLRADKVRCRPRHCAPGQWPW